MISEAPSTDPQPLSFLTGPTDPPLLSLTLASLLDLQALRFASSEFLVFPWTGARWSFERLRAESVALAKGLVALGVRRGDRVGVMAGDCEEFVALVFACGRIGAILVLFGMGGKEAEVRAGLEFVECKLFLTTQSIGKHIDNTELLQLLHNDPPKGLEEVILLRGRLQPFRDYGLLIDAGLDISLEKILELSALVKPEEVCNLQFTSGTTGRPKAAMLTHYCVTNNARFIGSRMAFTPSDTLCCPPPLFHCFGLVLGMLAALSHGTKIVYPSEVFDPSACVAALIEEDCTALHGVPAMFDAIFDVLPEGFASGRLRTGIVAGAPVPRAIVEGLLGTLGMREFTSSYGLTEASPTCFNAFYDDPLAHRLNTVGTLMPHAKAKIVDHDGKTVPVGVRGELCIAGYQLQAGYWRDPEKTAETMMLDEEGAVWLRTGDEAVFDGSGGCKITGRFKDIIIRGGENIYPIEIEERLAAHPAIARAVVVGLKHRKYGEVVTAFLQARDNERPSDEAIKEWTLMKLGRHKAPAHVFWFGHDGVPIEIPLTGSGKVRKFEIAQMGEALLARRRPKL
ncbi:long-chain fatty-acid-CoA ligase [Lophium mytilinum]|uniref:Long-chain fatty-acid-CoA ligase n=1 Tax=Lophium mytilinum TaxID=390894 RepID=A0A6A6R0J0_9PEZI|nr:long-chain fatty-acid-CoA ligase [Lophium mytilinum]